MPVDKIKIDRAFVHAISVTRNNRFIVDALIRLAAQLGLEVIAEGVETPADLDALERLGCTQVQGWLFHRALDAARCTELMHGERRQPA
jgi:EAL domain-containing protein (putative c-di-GMP-specific phosphodiesterase class I)